MALERIAPTPQIAIEPKFSLSALSEAPTIRAIKILGPICGSTNPQLMRGDDGRYYVVKRADNPFGPRILVNEFLAARLARMIGLTTPDFAILRIPGAPPGFGSRFSPSRHVHDWLPRSAWGFVENPSDLIGAFAFDVWTANVDARQVLFIRRPGQLPLRMTLIDNGHCFGGKTWRLFNFSIHCPSHLKFAYESVRAWSDLEPWLTRIESIDLAKIEYAISGIPVDWIDLSGSEPFAQLKDGLIQRAARIRAAIARLLVRGQHPFVCWRFGSALFAAPAFRPAGLKETA